MKTKTEIWLLQLLLIILIVLLLLTAFPAYADNPSTFQHIKANGEIVFGQTTVAPQNENPPTPSPRPSQSNGQGQIYFGETTIVPQTQVPQSPPTKTPGPASVQPNTNGNIIFGDTTIAPSHQNTTYTSTPPPPPNTNVAKTKRVLMFYVIGSNLESEKSLASKDLTELQNAHLDLDNTIVYVCAGGARKWRDLDLGAGDVAYYQLTRSGYRRMSEPRQLNMGNPATLVSFLKYCQSKSNADKYILVLWDHAGGPIYGYGSDELHNSDGMSIQQLAEAIRSGGFGGSNKLEAIIFDACLMGNVETAANMAPFAEYMLASEDSLPGNGLDYTRLSAGNLAQSASIPWLKTLAGETVNEFYKYYSDSVTLSVYDLTALMPVINEINNLFSGIFTQDACVAVSRRITGIKHVDHDSFVYDLYDLYGFALSNGNEGRQLQKAIDKTVIAHYGNKESNGLNGLSFFFPLNNSESKQYSVQTYKEIAANGYLNNYYQFLVSYVKNVRGISGKSLPPLTKKVLGAENQHNEPSVVVTKNVPVSNAIQLAKKGLRFEVSLDSELINSFVRSYYLILRKASQNIYYLVEQGHGLELSEKGVLSVTLEDHIRVISGEDGKTQILPFVESERGQNYLKGGTRLLRRRASNVQLLTGRIIHNTDKPSGFIASLSPFDYSPMVMKTEETIEPEDCLTPVYQVRIITMDANGEPLPFFFWKEENSGIAYGREFIVGNGGPRISFIPCGTDEEYYVQICVEDVNGVTYATSLAPLNKKED